MTSHDAASFLLVSVNNTRTRLGMGRGLEVVESRSVVNDDLAGVVAAARGLAGSVDPIAGVLVASVNDAAAGPISLELRDGFGGAEVYRVGRDIPVPLPMAIPNPETVGIDRQLNALAAWGALGQACITVDVGTAVTVDFVDGEGTFQGGAIAPGLGAMLDGLHRKAERLPELAYESVDPDNGPFGKSTEDAMRLGVLGAVRGLVRDRVEAYAEAYGTFVTVIATGGDMGVLEGDGLVERFVPDLTLMGMLAAANRALLDEDDSEAEAPITPRLGD
jgi:type III pantothenate kinase